MTKWQTKQGSGEQGSGDVNFLGWLGWPIQGFLKANFKDFAVQYWPRKTASTTVIGIGGFGIYKGSQNKEAAWEVIKELVSRETLQASDAVSVDVFNLTAPNRRILYFGPSDHLLTGRLRLCSVALSRAQYPVCPAAGLTDGPGVGHHHHHRHTGHHHVQ